MLKFLSTWTIMILLIVLLARTSWGRPIVYWVLWLAVVLLIVTHGEELSSLVDVRSLQLNG